MNVFVVQGFSEEISYRVIMAIFKNEKDAIKYMEDTSNFDRGINNWSSISIQKWHVNEKEISPIA